MMCPEIVEELVLGRNVVPVLRATVYAAQSTLIHRVTELDPMKVK